MNRLIAGLDIGNGYVKAIIEGNTRQSIDIPSCVAVVTHTNDIRVSVDADIEETMNDIYNQLDASFDSPVIGTDDRFQFGQRAIKSSHSTLEFDVYGGQDKSKQKLTYLLSLGCLAGKALQEYYAQAKSLPTSVLKVNVIAAFALPISEFMKCKNEYADSYLSNTHIVHIHNFEQDVTVEIKFEDVVVIAEGASAQKAISQRGEAYMESMLSQMRQHGQAESLEGITAKDVLAARSTLSVDIGEGTVNFPVFQQINENNKVKFDTDSSDTFNHGYGEVLNRALDTLKDMGYDMGSRKALQDFLNTPPTPLTRNKYKRIQAVVNNEIEVFTDDVAMQFSKVYSRCKTFVEVVYVYGGGASPVKEELYGKLINKISGGKATDICPILYLDSSYSRILNRDGLFIQASQRLNKTKK